jgi:UPF0271 protein
MYQIDLNCDLGESFGRYTLGLDEQVIPLITSANVACGYHASDPLVMERTVALAKDAGIHIGAHPGYPDLQGFGRRNMDVSPAEAKAYTTYQLGALDAFCKSQGVKLQHVKPHGAMYNMAGKDYALAKAIAEAIYEYDSSLIVMALASGQLVQAAKDVGLRVAREYFTDRAYEPDGSLVNRMVKEHKVRAVDGTDIELCAESVCVHGDGAKALEFVNRIRDAFKKEGIKICPLAEILG